MERGRKTEIQSVSLDGDFIQFELKCGRADVDKDVFFFIASHDVCS